MREARRCAVRSVGRVAPNPPVGAILVREGRLVSRAFHARFGGPHAEALALDRAGTEARGASLYVTLEPCRDAPGKKTPPCADAILRAGVRRVVYGVADPTPCGGGARSLAAAGVACLGGVGEASIRPLLQPWLKRSATGLPYVVAKWAMSLDGRIATRAGESRWITGEAARAQGRALRARCGAVLVGVGTVVADDPLLTARRPAFPPCLRVVADTGARTPPGCRLLRSVPDGPVLVLAGEGAPEARVAGLRAAGAEVRRIPEQGGRLDLEAALRALARRGVDALLVEGGGTILGSFFAAGLVDRVLAYVAPRVLAGRAAPGPAGDPGFARIAEAPAARFVRCTSVGADARLDAVLREY